MDELFYIPSRIGEAPQGAEAFFMPDRVNPEPLAMALLRQAAKPGKPMPKMKGKEVAKAANTTLTPFALQEASYIAQKAKREAEIKAYALWDKMINPEGLINEAAKKYLLQR